MKCIIVAVFTLVISLTIFNVDSRNTIFTFSVIIDQPDENQNNENINTKHSNGEKSNKYYEHSYDREKKTNFTPWPVIFVPGDGGSQVEAKLNKTDVVHYLCEKHTTDYFSLWLNLELLVPTIIDCWVDNMKLIYDNVTGTTRNSPGVDIRIPNFGYSDPVEWLDPSKASAGAYFKDIGNMLVSLGLERNKSLRGAPYDFRRAANEHAQYFIDFKTLVEDTYEQNGKRRVILIAHSMGSPMMLYFLNNQLQEWKDKYIRSLITLGGVWGGTVKTIKVYGAGDNLGSRLLNAHTLRSEQITSPSLAWLMPTDKFWSPDEVLVQTETRNYTVNDYHQFFEDVNYLDGWYMRKNTENLVYDLTPPSVEMHCLYGVGVDTADRMVYSSGSFPNGDPLLIMGDGDGTVNRRSLEGCFRWRTMQPQTVYSQSFPKAEHLAMLGNPDIIAYVKKVVTTP